MLTRFFIQAPSSKLRCIRSLSFPHIYIFHSWCSLSLHKPNLDANIMQLIVCHNYCKCLFGVYSLICSPSLSNSVSLIHTRIHLCCGKLSCAVRRYHRLAFSVFSASTLSNIYTHAFNVCAYASWLLVDYHWDIGIGRTQSVERSERTSRESTTCFSKRMQDTYWRMTNCI